MRGLAGFGFDFFSIPADVVDLETFLFQVVLQQLDQICFVFDDQNFVYHGLSNAIGPCDKCATCV